MTPHAARSQTTGALSVAPSLEPTLAREHTSGRGGRRAHLRLIAMAVALAVVAALVAQVLTALIALVTNLAFFQTVSLTYRAPATHSLGLLVLVVPVLGGLLVGVMARFGSPAIRGHGIPEAMEQVLTNESRIPARMTWLKPLSAAVAIGTGGPFGAEGPIIATGGALGSLLGQLTPSSPDERKTLLAAGAAAGMAATFGTPLAAVLLAVELLLFEFRARSIVPVALATVTATGVRFALVGPRPAFALADLAPPSSPALGFYLLLGATIGLLSIAVTRLVYAIEDAFARLPLHWMWWPALGGAAVGVVGLLAPRTLGVGYDNLDLLLAGGLSAGAMALLAVAKFTSWSLALGSGTSGGTLAPLFTIGGALGGMATAVAARVWPSWQLDPRLGALLGMAALFAGASRAMLASVAFAFETTRSAHALLPLLGACSLSTFVSSLGMTTSIMTEKIVRRGVRVPADYVPDTLASQRAGDALRRPVVTLPAAQTVAELRRFLASPDPGASHQGFPVVDAQRILGVLTRRDVAALPPGDDTRPLADVLRRPPVLLHPDATLREAAETMAREGIGRLLIAARPTPDALVGIVTRSDLVNATSRR